MSIEKFEVGKKYRFLKDGDGEELYCRLDVKAGQEFEVCYIENDWVFAADVSYRGKVGTWAIEVNSPNLDFELVEEEETSAENIEEENTNTDLIQQMITLQQEHNLTLMFDSDEVVVHIGDNDTEYKISSQRELTTLIEASNVLKSFERK